MTRRRTLFGGHDTHGGGHGDRPWVYFMIDSFFLVTQFFVLTFHIGRDLVVPHKLHADTRDPGGIPSLNVSTDVDIKVRRDTADSAPKYRINGGEAMDEIQARSKMRELVVGRNPGEVKVRICPEGNAIFGDVIPILGICKILEITEYRVQPTRRK